MSSAINLANVGNLTGFQGTNWTAYTPTFTGMGTMGTIDVYWRRLGENIQISGSFTVGTGTAVTAQMSLPSTFTIGSTGLAASVTNLVGTAISTTNQIATYNVLAERGLTYIEFGYNNAGAANGTVARQGSTLFGAGDRVIIFASFPISGWSVGGTSSSSSVSQLIKTGGNAGLGSTNTSVMKWGSTVSTVGGNLSYTETAANGGYILIGAAGDVDIDLDFGDSASTTTVAFAIDSTGSALSNGGTTLAGNPRLLGPSDSVFGKTLSTSTTSWVHTHWSTYCAAGAKIYVLSNSGTTANANCIWSVKLRTY